METVFSEAVTWSSGSCHSQYGRDHVLLHLKDYSSQLSPLLFIITEPSLSSVFPSYPVIIPRMLQVPSVRGSLLYIRSIWHDWWLWTQTPIKAASTTNPPTPQTIRSTIILRGSSDLQRNDFRTGSANSAVLSGDSQSSRWVQEALSSGHSPNVEIQEVTQMVVWILCQKIHRWKDRGHTCFWLSLTVTGEL